MFSNYMNDSAHYCDQQLLQQMINSDGYTNSSAAIDRVNNSHPFPSSGTIYREMRNSFVRLETRSAIPEIIQWCFLQNLVPVI